MLLFLAVAAVAWFVAAKTVKWKSTWFGAFLGLVFGTVVAFAFSWVAVMVISSDQDQVMGPDLANQARAIYVGNLMKFAPVMAGFAAYWSLRGRKQPNRGYLADRR